MTKKKECITVAELGINCNGDVEIAKKIIDVCDFSGIDLIKFQKRDIDLVYTKEELDSKRESPYGKTFREQKLGIEFQEKDFNLIDDYVINKTSLSWFASPWDVNSVDFLMKYDVPFMKVASALITDFDLLKKIKETNLPVIMSVGMSTKEEVDKAINLLGDSLEYILACTASYPCKDSEMKMNFINILKREYGDKYRIGFSNHNSGIIYIPAAVLMGAEMVEFHVTVDRTMYGSDQSASIEPEGIMKIAKYVKAACQAFGPEEWTIFPCEEKVKSKLRKK